MKRASTVVSFGRVFVAIALIAFGIQQFLFGDFVAGRARAWPDDVPGRVLWAFSSGALLVATGGAIAFATAKASSRHTARLTAIVTGLVIIGWAFVRQVPIAAADSSYGSAWTALGKALALSGGLFAVAGSLAEPRSARALITAGRVCLGLFMVSSGIQHFLWAPFVKTMVPAWIPGALFWTYFAGAALVAGGAGLIVPLTARMAGTASGLMIFAWLLILHIPRAASAPAAQLRNEWIAVFEALAFSGIALVVTAETSAGERAPAGQDLRHGRCTV
jgi:uncharacterized membrane protein